MINDFVPCWLESRDQLRIAVLLTYRMSLLTLTAVLVSLTRTRNWAGVCTGEVSNELCFCWFTVFYSGEKGINDPDSLGEAEKPKKDLFQRRQDTLKLIMMFA